MTNLNLTQRAEIAREPNPILRLCGLSAAMVRAALNTPRRDNIETRVTRLRREPTLRDLPLYEELLQRMRDGQRLGAGALKQLSREAGRDGSALANLFYTIFGSCEPTLGELERFVAAARRKAE